MFAVREEEQERVRKEEEENWSKALSGELSGPRPAALGAAESVTANVVGEVPEYLRIEEERDEEMYTAMFKILNGLRKHEDGNSRKDNLGHNTNTNHQVQTI